MSKPKIINYGCRLNGFEADIISSLATRAGLGDETIIINSCAVTKAAEKEAVSRAKKARRNNPNANIIVTGCAAQINPDQFQNGAGANYILGNDEKMRAGTFEKINADLSDKNQPANGTKLQTSDILARTNVTLDPKINEQNRTRAFVQIQNGCDHRCTFCIIPFGRGNSRSVTQKDIFTQIEQLLETGSKEIVLTGVDITAYGHDLDEGHNLTSIIAAILNRFPSLSRLRLSSIDSVEMDEGFLDLMASEKRLMPHLHLSLQAGNNLILKRMKRRHSREDAIKFCQQIKKIRPDTVFGADLIAGFPTEDEAMFADSLDLIDECGLIFTHVFPFSPRPGTPAARMPQLDTGLIKKRAALLREKAEKAKQAFLKAQIGRTVPCLIERGNKGRAEQFFDIQITTPARQGEILPIKIVQFENGQLKGSI